MESATLAHAIAPPRTEQRSVALPWYCVTAILGALCIPIGALWDISWHSTIGRDSFWTPAHITIHLGGLIPGFTAGWLALRATWFGTDIERAAAVRLGPFRAPLGAWVIIWGAFAMLLSAPFDDWWHNAYGLDVEILSPPHTVLAAGMYAVAIGALLLVLSHQNRTGDPGGSILFIFAAGILLTMSTIIVTEKSYPNQQLGSTFYQVAAAIYPMYLVAAARASKMRWAATGAAAVYMAILCAMIWILPLFRAQPMLAPIYNPVDRMVPPVFPLIMILPGFLIDLVLRFNRGQHSFWHDWLVAALVAGVFLAGLLAVQIPFSQFLLSPAANNAFFSGDRHWPYFARIGPWRYIYWDQAKDALTINGALIAFVLAALKSRVALAFGSWMSKVQR
jgi:hypothetical protein